MFRVLFDIATYCGSVGLLECAVRVNAGFVRAFASRLAPTFEMHSKVGASLLAKESVGTLMYSALAKHLYRTLLDLLFSQIFLVGREKPQMPIGVLQRSTAITVKLILDLRHHGCPGIQRPLE